MPIKQVIDDTKTRVAHSKRRAKAVTEHGKAVVATGVDAARNVAAVAVRNLKSAVQTQKETISDRSMPASARVRQIKSNAGELAAKAKEDITLALKDGYRSVSDRLAHVTSVSRKEQAIENKISRKAKKARKAASE